jgi:hypothetical protein
MDSPQAPTLAVPRDVIGSRHYAVGVPEFQNGSLRHDLHITQIRMFARLGGDVPDTASPATLGR